MNLKRFVLLLAAWLPVTTGFAAGFNGEISFTPAEREAHARHVGTITRVSRQYLENIWRDHLAFYKRHRVSKYYGDRNTSLNTRSKRIAALQAAGAPASLVDQLQPTSCVGLTIGALGTGFRAPGDPALESAWNKIHAYLRANSLDGCALQDALQKLGWRILFWNPAPANNARWDAQDGNRRSKGWHSYRYMTVMNKGTYYFNKVDDRSLLVNFGTNVPAEFRRIPFFVGTAHTGYHVFPGFTGEVIEAHSTRRLDSIDNMEKSPFNPLASGGAPRWTASEQYRSGLIAVPPR
jgi:hypothetical protein